jgi:hypothetical protein
MRAKFGKFGVRQSWNHIVVSWLRLQTTTDCIPHPYWMYKKCFSTFICCGWAYGCTLTLLYLCRWGPNFENLGSGRAVTTLRCNGWGFKPLLTASHILIRCIQSVLAPLYAVDRHMGAPLHCYRLVWVTKVALAAICLVFPVLVLEYKSFNVSMSHVPVPT